MAVLSARMRELSELGVLAPSEFGFDCFDDGEDAGRYCAFVVSTTQPGKLVAQAGC